VPAKALSAVLVALALLLLPGAAGATNLSSTAAAMSPGTFVELTGMNGFNNGAIFQPPGCPAGNSGTAIFQYHNKGQWNPIAKRVQVVAASHMNCGNGVRAIFYDDATNTWGDLPIPNVRSDPTHRYDQNAIDPATGRHYTTDYDSFSSYYLDNGAASWVTITRPSPGSKSCCTADAFFPTYRGGGRFFHFDGDWGLWSFNPANNRWQEHYQGNGGSGWTTITGAATSIFNHYSPLCQCLIIGGGSGLYKISNKGAVTRMSLSGAPSGDFRIDGSGAGTNVAVDPVTGFLITISTNGQMRQFNPTGAGTWTTLSTTIPAFMQNAVDAGDAASHLMSAPISDYGVIMYVKTNDAPGGSNSARVYLYKHAVASGNLTLPISKTGTGAGTVISNDEGINCGSICSAAYTSGTQVTLAANPTPPNTFGGWRGGGCTGTGTRVLTLSSNTTDTATFAAPQPGENPISESGHWTNGTAGGTGWNTAP